MYPFNAFRRWRCVLWWLACSTSQPASYWGCGFAVTFFFCVVVGKGRAAAQTTTRWINKDFSAAFCLIKMFAFFLVRFVSSRFGWYLGVFINMFSMHTHTHTHSHGALCAFCVPPTRPSQCHTICARLCVCVRESVYFSPSRNRLGCAASSILNYNNDTQYVSFYNFIKTRNLWYGLLKIRSHVFVCAAPLRKWRHTVVSLSSQLACECVYFSESESESVCVWVSVPEIEAKRAAVNIFRFIKLRRRGTMVVCRCRCWCRSQNKWESIKYIRKQLVSFCAVAEIYRNRFSFCFLSASDSPIPLNAHSLAFYRYFIFYA